MRKRQTYFDEVLGTDHNRQSLLHLTETIQKKMVIMYGIDTQVLGKSLVSNARETDRGEGCALTWPD